MRLISIYNYEMHEFVSSATPPYAILSHTWGNDEVTFQDMTLFAEHSLKSDLLSQQIVQHIKSKVGFKKIQYACQETPTRRIDWVWIDTCCIDKSSSSELSEAINSMFAWYRDAEICYAYLDDVTWFPEMSEEQRFEALRSARWFSRGWTLQELIAPPALELYGAGWSLLQ